MYERRAQAVCGKPLGVSLCPTYRPAHQARDYMRTAEPVTVRSHLHDSLWVSRRDVLASDAGDQAAGGFNRATSMLHPMTGFCFSARIPVRRADYSEPDDSLPLNCDAREGGPMTKLYDVLATHVGNGMAP